MLSCLNLQGLTNASLQAGKIYKGLIMTDRYYIVEIPGPKEHKVQVNKATSANIIDGCLVLYQELTGPLANALPVLVAAFAPGRWITCKLGVMKSTDEVKFSGPSPQETMSNA